VEFLEEAASRHVANNFLQSRNGQSAIASRHTSNNLVGLVALRKLPFSFSFAITTARLPLRAHSGLRARLPRELRAILLAQLTFSGEFLHRDWSLGALWLWSFLSISMIVVCLIGESTIAPYFGIVLTFFVEVLWRWWGLVCDVVEFWVAVRWNERCNGWNSLRCAMEWLRGRRWGEWRPEWDRLVGWWCKIRFRCGKWLLGRPGGRIGLCIRSECCHGEAEEWEEDVGLVCYQGYSQDCERCVFFQTLVLSVSLLCSFQWRILKVGNSFTAEWFLLLLEWQRCILSSFWRVFHHT